MTDSNYAIFGLGNPEKKYQNTRHNVGFLLTDFLIEKHPNTPIKSTPSTRYAPLKIDAHPVKLCQPQTYMNLSGKSVSEIVHYYKIPIHHVLIVYDDIDLPFGSIRIRKQGSAGTHNGMKSIIGHLKTTLFPRIRIGIGPKPAEIPLNNFVLSNFKTVERNALRNKLFPHIEHTITTWLTHGIDKAMNTYNLTQSISSTQP